MRLSFAKEVDAKIFIDIVMTLEALGRSRTIIAVTRARTPKG